MVLLPSTFPVLKENPYPEGEPHDETGGYNGVGARDENPALRRVATSHEILHNPRLVTYFAPDKRSHGEGKEVEDTRDKGHATRHE